MRPGLARLMAATPTSPAAEPVPSNTAAKQLGSAAWVVSPPRLDTLP